MSRRLGLVAACMLLCGAMPVPPRLIPDQPVLGRPLTLSIPLSSGDTVLGGIPPLGTFELLAPPITANGELRLLLMPMRLGPQELPSFPLLSGISDQQATQPLTVTVGDDLPATAVAAPLMALPATPFTATSRSLWPAWLLFPLAAAALFWFRLRRPAQPEPVPLEQLAGSALLTELARRLAQLPPTNATETLRVRLERARFAPQAAGEPEGEGLLREFLALGGGTP